MEIKDIVLYIGEIKAGNVTSVTYGITAEVENNETFPDGINWVKGKRVITGSFTFEQSVTHPLIEAVFKMVGMPVPREDKIPKFDATFTGISQEGEAVKLVLYGIDVTKECWNSVDNLKTIEFKALATTGWRPIETK